MNMLCKELPVSSVEPLDVDVELLDADLEPLEVEVDTVTHYTGPMNIRRVTFTAIPQPGNGVGSFSIPPHPTFNMDNRKNR